MGIKDNSFFVYLLGYDESIYLKYKELIDDLANTAYNLARYSFNNYMDYNTEETNETHLFDVMSFLRNYELLKQSGKYNTSKGLSLLINGNAKIKVYDVTDKEKEKQMEKEFTTFLVKDMNAYSRIMKDALKFVKAFDTFRDLIHQKEKIDEKAKLINSYLRNNSRANAELGIFDVHEFSEGILYKVMNETGIYVRFEISKNITYKYLHMYINGKRKKYEFINENTIEVGPYELQAVDKINPRVLIDKKELTNERVSILSLR